MSNYDSIEARRLLAVKEDEIEPLHDERVRAAKELLDSLLALNGASKFRISNEAAAHVYSVWFPNNSRPRVPNVAISYNSRNHDFELERPGRSALVSARREKLKLEFDPLNMIFLGYEMPAPNERRARESALTALVRAALDEGPEPASSDF